ncbi:hypothetical protein FVEN_g4436 [Fusarium venenatum]|uniref:Uncharacterized protein n=1 Tax=Fusarium venenatum TaxID=56646 RepID=A0A2L2TDP8_9HYPO|nr:uncharacterized protein FVRRES_02675 [Fusarium venenatum]KAG8357853.1 hypothetical protein FVEN_g4436 [Fusarium venenatum]KAH7004238.1 hypothetical protein EDB82DRAFT_532583 [Fusarium venenatum]CEI66163.1 unnamed protein product [Fusarium venenatum]
MAAQQEIDPRAFFKDGRFSQTFHLPADPSDDRGTAIQVKYADYGYRNPSNPQEENVLLFFAPLCASRIIHCAKDELAKKHHVRIVVMDRPGFGGTDPVKLEKRAVICRKMTLALLKHLEIGKVSVACHSGGTVYALDMLLHHPEILHPGRSYMAIGAPWVLPSRSNIWSMSFVKALPVGMMAQADKAIGFFNNTLGPAFTSSVGFSQLFTTPTPLGPEGDSEFAKFEESLEPHLFKIVHAESIEGFSDESLLLMQKINGISGFGDWLDYDDLVPKLVSVLRESGRQLTIDVFYAETDSMIGAPETAGPQWMNACWKGEQVGDTISYNAKTIKGADHNTIWSIRRGVPEEVFKKLSQ